MERQKIQKIMAIRLKNLGFRSKMEVSNEKAEKGVSAMEQMPLMIILEENKMDSTILRDLFENEYRVVEYQSAEETIKRLEDQEKVDIILWNMILNYQKKVDLLTYILSKDRYRDTTLIAIVESGDDYGVTTALEYGASDVISKPFNPELVHRRIRHFTKEKMKKIAYDPEREHRVDVRKGSREIDALTGLYNAHAFYRHTRQMLDEDPNTKYLMIYWNIDCFKVVNDLYGRTIGDEILQKLAAMLKDRMGTLGTYGRIGADNFACCLPAQYFTNEDILKRHGSYHFKSLGVDYKLTLHTGLFYIEEKDRKLPISQICDWAKMAAETIKGKYGCMYAIYDNSMRERMLEEQAIIADMERALENREFFIQVQPIFDAFSKRIVSGEVLVRWRHPEKGIIPPYKFISVFESNGMITQLDHYVWEEACKVICQMKEQGKCVPVSVNVSRVNLFNPNLGTEILELLEKYKLTTQDIKLEITESAYTENPEQMMEAVKALKDKHFDILMDDFGSGYSSLNMLKDLPVDILKVDMRFMDELETSEKAINVVTSIVHMAKWINMIVVAEGVETEAQSEFLENIGCDRIQGYLYSRPVDTEVFLGKLLEMPVVNRELECERKFEDVNRAMEQLPIELRLFIENVVGVMGVFTEINGKYEVLKVNDAYYKMFEDTPYNLYHHRKDFFMSLSEEELDKVHEMCQRAEKEQQKLFNRIIRFGEEGYGVPIRISVKYIGKIRGNKSYHFSMQIEEEII